MGVKENTATAVLVAASLLTLSLILAILFVWPAMIMFGVVHSYWAWLPAFGFWQTFGILVLVRFVFPTASVQQNS